MNAQVDDLGVVRSADEQAQTGGSTMSAKRSGARLPRSRAGWVAVLAFALVAASCGSSSDGASGDGADGTTTTAAAGTSTTAPGDTAEHEHDEPTPAADLPPCPDEPAVDPHTMSHGGDGGDDHDDASHGGSRDCRLPAAVQAELDQQLAVTRSVLERYPDAAAARAGGYELTEGNSHIVSWDQMDDEFDVDHPEMLLLDDEGDTDRVVAAVYYVVTDDTDPPDGFVGTRDLWHPHAAICAVPAETDDDGALVPCDDEEPAQCEVALLRSGPGGACREDVAVEGADGWMLHVWEVPAHPNPLGLFSTD